MLSWEPELNRIIFSEREPVEDKPKPATLPPIFSQIRAGETRRGCVTKLTAFGAFVDLGGYEGLIHVSELAWSASITRATCCASARR